MLYYLTVVFGKFRKLGLVNQGVITGCLLVIVAACALPAWFIYSQSHANQSSVQQPAVKPYSAPKNSVSGTPVRLNVPSLQINLAVIDGHYDEASHGWTLTSDSAQYFVQSAQPNNTGGKTFIYGHYRDNVFAGLHNIKPGAALSLTTKNGYRFNYRFESTFTTSPSNLSVLDNTKRPVLYLQTCSGVFFQHRQIFTFKYIGYKGKDQDLTSRDFNARSRAPTRASTSSNSVPSDHPQDKIRPQGCWQSGRVCQHLRFKSFIATLDRQIE